MKVSAALNTILFQQNLKMTLSAGGDALEIRTGIKRMPSPSKTRECILFKIAYDHL
jgi:hypothetical protein